MKIYNWDRDSQIITTHYKYRYQVDHIASIIPPYVCLPVLQ